LLLFYGEDSSATKPEDFFGMLVSFSTMLQKSQLENEAMAKRLNKSQQMASTKVKNEPASQRFMMINRFTICACSEKPHN